MLRCNVMKLTDKSTGTYISNLNKTLTYQVLRRDQAKNVNIKKVSLGKATAPRPVRVLVSRQTHCCKAIHFKILSSTTSSVTLDKRLQSLWWPSFVFQQRESVHRGRTRGSGVTHWTQDTFSKASFNLMTDFYFLPLRDLNNPEEKTGPLNSNRS